MRYLLTIQNVSIADIFRDNITGIYTKVMQMKTRKIIESDL